MAAGPEVARAYVTIIPSMEGAQNTIAQELGASVDEAGQKAGSGFGKALQGGMAVAGTAIAAVGAATVKLGSDFISGAKNVASYGDDIDKMSQKMGVSAEKYQEWDFILQHSGSSMSTMKASMKTLANAVENGNEAFEKIGLTMEDLEGMSQEQIFEATIAGLQGVEDTTERTYLAGQLLGRGATELGALLNTSAEDVQAMKDQVHELGGVMSDDAVKASAAFQDSLQNLTVSLDGIKNQAMAQFLPAMTDVMDGLSMVFSGKEGGVEQISKGIDEIVTGITNALPKLSDVALKIVESLGTAIIENLPKLLDVATNIVMSLAEMIISNLPQVVSTGLEVIVQLAQGITESLPTLIPTIIDVILSIVETLIDNADMLIDGAIALILGLAEGLINALPKLIEKAPEIVIKLVDAIVKNAPKILDAGIKLIITLGEGLIKAIPQLTKNIPIIVTALVNGFKQLWSQFTNIGSNIVEGIRVGLANAWDSIINWIKEKCAALVDTVKSFFGIHSPSTLFRDEVGKNLALGIGEGYVDEMQDVNKRIESSLQADFNISPTVTAEAMTIDTEGVETNNDDVVYKLDQMIKAITNLRVVLDSGKTVGALISEIDNSLGVLRAREAM